ncbi:hypothetical protein IGI04_013192 [Brassica rapa subsp. trilocularis]|uniref:Uncharacterized protein n=1 Tax=Brassica rapa subsp. trilocularis TaxID=1813537 RepID=A0ABQ7N853_BRACM|nr:hypothetical protein IGI04_013192 [Brassica rapa subsp. trilocularis]
MQNQWLVPGRLSGLKPPYVDADDPSLLPPAPPDPPDTRPPTIPLPPSLVERIRRSEDKTLKGLALVSISPSGRFRVLIPDYVF